MENRVINGEAASHHPHHTFISYQNAQGGGFFGAGSIITATHVLTVAQIVRGWVTWNVGFGSHQYAQLTWVRTELAIMHPNYNVDSRDNDIAVLVMPVPFVWSATVQPVSLPTNFEQGLPMVNEQGTIIGFGWTSDAGQQATTLQAAFVRVIPDTECQNLIVVSFPNHFCAVDRTVPSNICQGDLGGGFLTHHRNQLVLTGLNSILLEGCAANWPSAYTRVQPYLGWISSVTGL